MTIGEGFAMTDCNAVHIFFLVAAPNCHFERSEKS